MQREPSSFRLKTFKALIYGFLLWGVRPNPPLGEQPGVKNTDEFVQIRIRSARGVLVTQLKFAFFVCVWVSERSHPIWVAQTCLWTMHLSVSAPRTGPAARLSVPLVDHVPFS